MGRRPTVSPPPKRRRFGRVLAELHYELRTEGHSPLRTAASVGLGTAVGCLPIWGAHLPICLVLARLLRISRIKTYLAAHIGNPLTAPILLYLGFGLGRLIFEGRWPRLTIDDLRASGALGLGRDLLVGSLVLGIVLGSVVAVVAWLISSRSRRGSLFTRVREETARRYLDAGVFHWEFVRGKLRFDPLYQGLLAVADLPGRGRLVDLGCGRGIVPAMLQTARTLHAEGQWDDSLPAPPRELELHGVEGRPAMVEVARTANGDGASIECADLTRFDPGAADVVLLLDALHYLGATDQERLIRRIAAGLRPSGVLIVREPDAGLGLRFLWTRAGERLAAWLRLEWRQRYCYRGAQEWCALFRQNGLEPTVRPMWAGTPHGNVLIEARVPGSAPEAALPATSTPRAGEPAAPDAGA